MKQQQVDRDFGRVIKTLKPIHVGRARERRLRTIERNGKRFLDIRDFVQTKKYTGPTKRE
jgi:hypothetical protein